MQYEEIGEPIEVITYFHDGLLKPLRFRWQQRVYRITRLHGHWQSRTGAFPVHHFSVGTGGPDVYELQYSTDDQLWRLQRIAVV